jgi:hypothetical protein
MRLKMFDSSAPADDAPGVGGAAAAARRALAVLLQQWLPACLDRLLLPVEGAEPEQQQQGLAGGLQIIGHSS